MATTWHQLYTKGGDVVGSLDGVRPATLPGSCATLVGHRVEIPKHALDLVVSREPNVRLFKSVVIAEVQVAFATSSEAPCGHVLNRR